MDDRSGKQRRITHRADIDQLFHQGRRLGNGLVTLLVRPNGLDFARTAVAVSTAHGAAVRRNRIKRLCREALRLAGPELPAGWDFVVVPRRGVELSLPALRQSVASLARRVTAPAVKEQHP